MTYTEQNINYNNTLFRYATKLRNKQVINTILRTCRFSVKFKACDLDFKEI